jgi:hypothetical protein
VSSSIDGEPIPLVAPSATHPNTPASPEDVSYVIGVGEVEEAAVRGPLEKLHLVEIIS